MNPRLVLSLALLLTAGACSGPREGGAGESTRPAAEPAMTVLEMIGRKPGVYVDDRGRIYLRGSSIQPLIVVDGAQLTSTDLSFLNPRDVEKIEILTGADASMYGIRGGAGVVVITTKHYPLDGNAP